MIFKKSLLAMMMFGAAAAQADYRVELEAAYATGSGEYDADDSFDDYDTDTDSVQLGGTVYFSPVSTAKGPLDEAVFLSKSSGISVGYVKSETDVDYDYDSDGDDWELKSNLKVAAGHFVLPSPNLIFEVAIGQGKDEELDFDYMALGFGGYINDRITLKGEYSKQEFDEDGFDESIEKFTVTYRQLIEFGGDRCLALEPYIASVDYFDEDGAEVGIDIAWYITRSLGLKAGVSGLAIEADFGDYTEGHSHIGIDYFINESFRIGGALLSASSEFDGDDGADDDESESGAIQFDMAVRF